MSLMNEYIAKQWNVKQFEDELTKLIKKYNRIRGTYLFVHVSAFEKPIPERILLHEDYYTIHDLLTNKDDQDKLDFFLETPGGMGEVAEEIDQKMKSKGRIPFPPGKKIACVCGKEIDLTPVRDDAEKKIGKKFVF